MKGKWAQGIQPRHFCWIVQDRLAVSERPGGYGPNHRRVRRQEEIIWLREQAFSCVVSLIPSPHNLHNYEELGVAYRHVPFGPHDDPSAVLGVLLPELRGLTAAPGRVLVHQEELGDRVCGVMAAYLVWTGMVPQGPKAITIVEQITGRQLGPPGRQLAVVAERVVARGQRA